MFYLVLDSHFGILKHDRSTLHEKTPNLAITGTWEGTLKRLVSLGGNRSVALLQLIQKVWTAKNQPRKRNKLSISVDLLMETKQSNFTLLLHRWEENCMNKKQTDCEMKLPLWVKCELTAQSFALVEVSNCEDDQQLKPGALSLSTPTIQCSKYTSHALWLCSNGAQHYQPTPAVVRCSHTVTPCKQVIKQQCKTEVSLLLLTVLRNKLLKAR